VIAGRADAAAEPTGFREFVETQSGSLLRAAWLLTGEWGSAEDLVQTALVVAWSHWSKPTRPDAPQLYVRRVMLRTFLRWRSRRWNGEIVTELPDLSDGHNPIDAVELRQSVNLVLAALPARQRAVVVLRYFLDLTEAQTADVLGCSVGSVKKHAARALATLRQSPGLTEIMSGGVTS
jgi:RNA polymerase sigma-70 factor (sigma-E family)